MAKGKKKPNRSRGRRKRAPVDSRPSLQLAETGPGPRASGNGAGRVSAWVLNFVVFLAGACVMVLELLGARILAPFYGMTSYVWSALIGVTIGSLAVGYWLGGILVDRRPKVRLLWLVFALAGLATALLPAIRRPVLLSTEALGLRFGVLAAAFLLFALPAMLLGAVAPFAVRLATREVDHVGRKAGRLYALSSVGSVAGTLVAAFVLIPTFGVVPVLYGVAATLLLVPVVGFALGTRGKIWGFVVATMGVLSFLLWTQPRGTSDGERIVFVGPSPYGSIKVVDKLDRRGDREVQTRWLLIDSASHTAVERESGRSVFAYAQCISAVPLLRPQAQKALVVGLGGGSIPMMLERAGLLCDVVELDPVVLEVAVQYFDFSSRGRTVLDDGRHFIRHCRDRYDIVVLDVYAGWTRPRHMLSVEFLREVERVLEPEGVVVFNTVMLAGPPGAAQRAAEQRTMTEVFPHSLFYSTGADPLENSVAFLSKAPLALPDTAAVSDPALRRVLERMRASRQPMEPVAGPLITDDYSPVELSHIRTAEAWLRSIRGYFSEDVLLD